MGYRKLFTAIKIILILKRLREKCRIFTKTPIVLPRKIALERYHFTEREQEENQIMLFR